MIRELNALPFGAQTLNSGAPLKHKPAMKALLTLMRNMSAMGKMLQ